MKVLVTGASGFIGTHLLEALREAGHQPVASGRTRVVAPGVFWVPSPELGPDADWSTCLDGVEAVVHLAGRAHVLSARPGGAEEQLCRRINGEGTRVLAHQAAAHGVRHFVFMSSCHAVAAESEEPLTADTPPRPSSAYARSKLDAEHAVQDELASSAWTILRPPLVYGPGNTANFARLWTLARTSVPLPLASVKNRRSFLFVGNLTGAVIACLENPASQGKIYLPSDAEIVSTPELLRSMGRVLEREEGGCGVPRLFPFPESALRLLGQLPGLASLRKLTASLCVDSKPLRRDLGWRPRFSLEEGLAQALSSGSIRVS